MLARIYQPHPRIRARPRRRARSPLDLEMGLGGALLPPSQGLWRTRATPGSRCQVPNRRYLRRLELHLSATAWGGPKRLPSRESMIVDDLVAAPPLYEQ
jgi:hypothetical protein